MESKCSTKKMTKPLFLYFIIWTVSVLAFWLGLNKDAMGYGVIRLYIVLPITTFSSLMVGRDNSWGVWNKSNATAINLDGAGNVTISASGDYAILAQGQASEGSGIETV